MLSATCEGQNELAYPKAASFLQNMMQREKVTAAGMWSYLGKGIMMDDMSFNSECTQMCHVK